MQIETCGTLQLKIARIERQLELFKEQLSLSIPYPDHTEKLKQGVVLMQAQLGALIRQQQRLGLDKRKESKC